MRYNGHNVLAIVVAAIAIYLIEFVIFAVLIPGPEYMAMTGMVEGQGDPARMPVGMLLPILTAVGLSLVIKWRNSAGWMGGLMTAVWMALLIAFPTSLYSYVYGTHTEQFVAVNLGHFLVCYAAAGAILGAWK